jgi:hypothetical protein
VKIHVAIQEYKANGLRISRSGGKGEILDTVRCVVVDGSYSGMSITIQLTPSQRPKDFELLAFADIEVPDYAIQEVKSKNICSTKAGLFNATYKTQADGVAPIVVRNYSGATSSQYHPNDVH